MLALDLTLAQAALVGGWVSLAAHGRWHVAALVAGLNSACGLAVGIVTGNRWVIGLNVLGILAFGVFWWRGGPRGRKRARKALGDESQQLRDGLVRRMRQRVTTRPSWLPSPSS
jgi:hypothetical protein